MQNYFSRKNELSERAQHHSEHMEEKYRDETIHSVNKGEVIRWDDSKGRNSFYYIPQVDQTHVILCNLDTVKAIETYKDCDVPGHKMVALNFASFKNPGGMFLKGSSAQEEMLCHSSNLYNVLVRYMDEFYIPNRKNLNKALYNSDLIYSPDIVFENHSDGTITVCDVITCAAPNRTAAVRYKKVLNDEIHVAIIDRINRILEVAADKTDPPNTLILGAFGCGVFGNNPSEVSSIFKKALNTTFSRIFSRVVFAIPDETSRNYREFKNELKKNR